MVQKLTKINVKWSFLITKKIIENIIYLYYIYKKCRLCDEPIEDLKHFLLDCLQLTKIMKLQRPRHENVEEVIGDFLFEGLRKWEEMISG